VRTILVALLMTLATQAGATGEKYSDKTYKDISKAIDFLLSLTTNVERC